MNGTVYMVPVTMGESSVENVIPSGVISNVVRLRYFIVENTRTARRFLRAVDKTFPIDDSVFFELNKHTKPDEIEHFMQPLYNGNNIGVMSEAGVPGVADPGALIVEYAHSKGIKVVPYVGPSSILMSLMASGLNGQNFAFNGYLPVKGGERVKSLKHLEKRSLTENQSQLFIETPYRNNALVDDIINACMPETRLCIAADISLDTEYIVTMPVRLWKKNKPDLNKRPAIFIIQA